MTKYEWENELTKNLKRLPDIEVSKILDYYNELFFDKADTGLSEKEIIKSFGNPFDVAYKVVYGFEGEETAFKTAPPQDKEEFAEYPHTGEEFYGHQPSAVKRKRKGGIIARIIFFVPFFVIFVTLWSLVISLIAGGLGCAIGGLGIAIWSLFQIGNHGSSAAANIGLGLVASGVGLILIVFVRAIFKSAIKLTQKYFYIGKHKTSKRRGK